MTAVQARLPPDMRLRRVVRHHPGRIVYAAWWEDRSVAVTVLPWPPHSDSEAVRIFTDQLDRVARLDHPHLAPVMRHGVTDLCGWYVHPHPECATLAERLRETGPMSLKDLTRLVAQVASALDYLHRHGVVHGCVHPDTILADDEGWVRLVDAALRQAFVPLAAETGQWDLLIPEPYVAPEHRLQRPSSVGPSVDQFALGTTVYAGLGCGDPFVRENGKRSRVPVTDRRDDLPDHVDAVLARAMHAVPGGRYPSVLEFVAALDQQTHGAGAMGEPQSQLTTWAKRLPMPEPPESVELPEPVAPRRPFGVAVGLVALLLAGALWATWDTLGPPSTPEASAPQPRTERDDLVGAATPLEADIPAEPGSEADAERQPAPPVAVTEEPAATTEPEPVPAQPPRPTPASAPSTADSLTSWDAPGVLYVHSRPWGYVEIDGERVGHTPLVGVPIAAGTHRMRVIRDGFRPHEQVLYVRPGGELRLVHITLEEVKP